MVWVSTGEGGDEERESVVWSWIADGDSGIVLAFHWAGILYALSFLVPLQASDSLKGVFTHHLATAPSLP